MENEKKNQDMFTKENLFNKEEFLKKENLIEFLIEVAIFGWNVHVIFNNFCVGDGYIWAILGIIINLGIIGRILLTGGLLKLGLLFVIFMIVGIGSCNTLESRLEKSAVEVVNQIVERNVGKTAMECTKVKINKQKKDGTYVGTAYFDDDDDTEIKVLISYDKENDCIEVRLVEN